MTKIIIKYFGNDEPVITVEGPVTGIDIELIDGEEEHWLYLKHGDVSVYHTESHQDMFSEDWFSPIRGQEDDADEAFDIRELEEVPSVLALKYSQLFPDDLYKQRVAWAIDNGYLTEEGYKKQ